MTNYDHKAEVITKKVVNLFAQSRNFSNFVLELFDKA